MLFVLQPDTLKLYIIITTMASLKDKLKSKIRPKNQPQTMECFDQTSLNVQLVQGKNQLIEMKIQCGWTNNKMEMRLPNLKCQWYNRTQKNYQAIDGIEEETYQPSILDVGSIIEVTCIPQLPGVNYEGMPILLKSLPVTLAPETEAEANRIQQTGKGKYLVNLKEVKIEQKTVPSGSEALLKIQQGSISFLLLKVSHSNNQISNAFVITEQWPQLVISRKNPRRILMKFSQQDSCVVLFKNGEVRDSFCLFMRLYIAKKALNELEKQQKLQTMKEEEKVESQPQITDEKTQQNPLKEEETVQVSSSDSFKSQKNEIPHLSKQTTTTDLLQLINLKEEIKKLQLQNSTITKQLDLQKEKVYSLENSLQQTNERVQNASKNYFQLEQKLTSSIEANSRLQKQLYGYKKQQNSKQQEFLYYKNELKLKTDQNTSLLSRLTIFQETNAKLEKEVSSYRQFYSNNTSLKSYQQVIEELMSVKEDYEQLKLKSDFYVEERQKMEENLKNSRNLIEQIESEKKYVQKKYQSLTNQINSSGISPHSSKIERSNQNSPSSSMVFEEPPHLETRDSFLKLISSDSQNREREILQLKRHIKQLVKENNSLRSLLTKQKKPSSRTFLKLQLIEVKKIVSRLSQQIAQKQAVISNLRSINKDINHRKARLEHQYQDLFLQIKNQA